MKASTPPPCRILLAVTGLSPQIVTETLYALAVAGRPAWVPDQIHLITTTRGADNARLKLLSDAPGWFHRLREDYALPAIDFREDYIHVLRRRDGSPLEDIRDDDDNQQAADMIAETVRQLTADPTSEVHASIAGGRKTMGFYLGYAMSLYGRAQDRLSHVLVSAPYEAHPEFYYPTPKTRVITSLDRSQDALDCSRARVWLGDIPFVRLREGLPERLLTGQSSFSAAVAAAGRSLGEPRLELVVSQRSVRADGVAVELGATEFSVLLWFAQRLKRDCPEIDWTTRAAAEEFIALAQRVMNPASSECERLENSLAWRMDDPKALGEYFEPQKSRLRRTFVAALGERAARRYLIRRIGPRGASRYLLPLEPRQIDIQS